MENDLHSIESIGEFGLIKDLAEGLGTRNPLTIRGIGDDAAVCRIPKGEVLVTSTDVLVEGIHFDMSYSPLKHLGYKAVAVNLSDIYAMNAKPQQITFSIALSSKYTVEAVRELYAGAELACETYGVDLVGGDTSSSKYGMFISVTALGTAKEEDIVYRDGAKEKDLLLVSGDLGAAYLGLQILERERLIYKENPGAQPDLAGFDYVLERQLKPEPRQDVIAKLKELDVKPTSMIDISDGLASECLHLAEESEVSVQLYDTKIPIVKEVREGAKEFNMDPSICALNGGEDYELLFTIAQADFEKIKDEKLFSVIGYIDHASVGSNLIDASNNVHTLTAQGWNAFKSE